MADAKMQGPNGLEITVHGTPEEITKIINAVSQSDRVPENPGKARAKSKRLTLAELLEELKVSGFFAEPRSLQDVKDELQKQGQHYPNTTLSPALLARVRNRALRRISKEGHWNYVQ